MDFTLNDDHLALRDAVQRFCESEYPAQDRGKPESEAQATKRRAAMAGLGLFGLPFAADVGGSELGAVEVLLVAQELGQALGDGAFISSTVMAGHLLSQLGDATQHQRWLPQLSSGASQAAVALYEEGARYEWQRSQTRAATAPNGWLINGRKTLVVNGDQADLLLVVARTSGDIADRAGLSVFAVGANARGVHIQGFDTLDGRRAAHIDFQNVRVNGDCLLGAPGLAARAVESSLDTAVAALCAEAVGAVEAILVLTTEHLRTRKQFGAPLAKLQVLQHRVADMAIALEQLKSMACAAAMAVQANNPQQHRHLVSAAKVLVSQKGREIGLMAIQLHGAMGMTDECRISHYAKRLIVIGQLFGDAAWHLQRMSQAH